MKEFDEARTATEELFEKPEQLSVDDVQAQEVEEQVEQSEEVEQVPAETEQDPAQEQMQPEQPEQEDALGEAANTAEVAAQVAQEKDMQLQQALQELEAIKAQNQQMQGALEELSQKNKETLVEEALQMPVLDVNGLAFADQETIEKALAEYARQMAAYVKGDVLKEVSPFVEQAKEGLYQREKAETLASLAHLPELAGIEQMQPQLDSIIANNKWLQSEDMPIEEKFINAYAIARGVNAINTPREEPKELTSEDLMKLYDENPTFQELVEKRRIETIKQSQQVPPFSASSGAVNAALNIKEKPKTFEEASERTRKMFGLE